eukprot:CAMPEP_0206223028 /NCGR_PEP_ID=MMETSP0047_2-20121206/6271_1 /ASSEMBLY_ACC=CAM_ASM_000192 /TAXON_ID=195065 /ORGANISM="Chroomonas mesostigmatica_cf, Strain CCMP1168" /LENGTH=63 /DNA_ID=CAMNT_0053645885 /DNA_START=665 /DNA_END=856 /DNA_ORIENTATION=-
MTRRPTINLGSKPVQHGIVQAAAQLLSMTAPQLFPEVSLLDPPLHLLHDQGTPLNVLTHFLDR